MFHKITPRMSGTSGIHRGNYGATVGVKYRGVGFNTAWGVQGRVGLSGAISLAGNGHVPDITDLFVGQDTSGAGAVYNRANTQLYFGTNNIVRFSIDANGLVVVNAPSTAGAALTVNGPVTINDQGQALALVGNAVGNAASEYMVWLDSASTRQGYIGKESASTADIGIQATLAAANLNLRTASGSLQGVVGGSSIGVVQVEYIEVLNSAYTLTSQTAAQKLLNATSTGALTIQPGTYEFDCLFELSAMSATSGSFGFALGGTAVLGSQAWWAVASKNALLGGVAPSMTFNTTANTTLATADVNTTGYAQIKGIIRVTTAGTLIPQVSLTVAAAAIVGTNSYFSIRAASPTSGTFTNIGAWI